MADDITKEYLDKEGLTTYDAEIKKYISNDFLVDANRIAFNTLSAARLPTVPVMKGGTGATTEEEARKNIGAVSENDVKALITEHNTAAVGIASVTQTTTSTADDGNNVLTVTLTDGTKTKFTVQNGSKGDPGPAGAAAAKYITDIDQEELWTTTGLHSGGTGWTITTWSNGDKEAEVFVTQFTFSNNLGTISEFFNTDHYNCYIRFPSDFTASDSYCEITPLNNIHALVATGPTTSSESIDLGTLYSVKTISLLSEGSSYQGPIRIRLIKRA